ncbi:DUF6624 domain-containing protein [Streptacidiphilus albus]|uniref:DUF6624 domain-containing protein n=1 Tax=Streptacidiphilus albus TaxID=105425 RepID=UPI00068A6DF6|nr:DUF6624 domain-containing protein [Streptacidiphilus albus]
MVPNTQHLTLATEAVEDLVTRAGAARDLRRGLLAAPSFEHTPAAVKAADQSNTDALRRYLDQHGWPSEVHMGTAASRAATEIALRADRDPLLQQRCRDLLAEAVADQRDSPVRWAYLVDRCALNQAEPQIYGTACYLREGGVALRAVRDPEHLDERRATVGLGPHREYLDALERTSTGPARGLAALPPVEPRTSGGHR